MDLWAPDKTFAIQSRNGQNIGNWLNASWLPHATAPGTTIRKTYSLTPRLFTKAEKDLIVADIPDYEKISVYNLIPIT